MKYYLIMEACKELKTTRQTIYSFINKGFISAHILPGLNVYVLNERTMNLLRKCRREGMDWNYKFDKSRLLKSYSNRFKRKPREVSLNINTKNGKE